MEKKNGVGWGRHIRMLQKESHPRWVANFWPSVRSLDAVSREQTAGMCHRGAYYNHLWHASGMAYLPLCNRSKPDL